MWIRMPREGNRKTGRRIVSDTLPLIFLLVLAVCGLGARSKAQQASSPKSDSSKSGQGSHVQVPKRPAKPLYKGEQGKQGSEIEFAPASRTVTIKLRVEDSNGYFLPNIRRENFAVL